MSTQAVLGVWSGQAGRSKTKLLVSLPPELCQLHPRLSKNGSPNKGQTEGWMTQAKRCLPRPIQDFYSTSLCLPSPPGTAGLPIRYKTSCTSFIKRIEKVQESSNNNIIDPMRQHTPVEWLILTKLALAKSKGSLKAASLWMCAVKLNHGLYDVFFFLFFTLLPLPEIQGTIHSETIKKNEKKNYAGSEDTPRIN
eukprot:1144163-Pelagomonas_calceolata.AAC.9